MNEKQLLRDRVRASRDQRAARVDRAAAANAAVTAKLQGLVCELGARTVTSFVSVNGEPDTAAFHGWALEHRIRVLLPRVPTHARMEWAAYDGGAMDTGAFNIPEPRGPRIDVTAAHVDLMLIPAAAVDTRGARLGWGRGFFDRALSEIRARAGKTGHSPEVFAVVFDDEVVADLPTEPHDELVTGAVTEAQTYRFG